MLLKDKTAIIYGAAGSIGSGAARTFAGEGARVYLGGRTQARLEKLAAEILRNQRDNLEILRRVDEINGMLVDLMS